jgi:hypothetical protein
MSKFRFPRPVKKFGLGAFVGLALSLVGVMSAAAQDSGSGSVQLPLIKLSNPTAGHRLYIKMLGLGQRKVDVPLLFDTGHAGISVDCKAVLGAELCTEDGIKADKELLVDGIRITTKKISMKFESVIEHGQLAYAQVKFGSPESPISTSKEIPFFLRYKEEDRATGKATRTEHMGVFGVSPIDATSQGEFLKSPPANVEVGPGFRRGFYLSPIGEKWVRCSNKKNDCPLAMSLHIGIDANILKEFALTETKRLSNRYAFPTVEACVAVQKESICKQTLFDTGAAKIIVSKKPKNNRETFLPVGANVAVSGPIDGEWKFKTKSAAEVQIADFIDFNVVGIRYFENNSLLFDFEKGQMGFRLGR